MALEGVEAPDELRAAYRTLNRAVSVTHHRASLPSNILACYARSITLSYEFACARRISYLKVTLRFRSPAKA